MLHLVFCRVAMPGLFSNTGTSYKSYFVNKYIAELQEMKYAQRHSSNGKHLPPIQQTTLTLVWYVVHTYIHPFNGPLSETTQVSR